MELEKWKTQIVRGTLEYCILLMLKRQTCYGYQILQNLQQYPMIASTESTVYPLLRRLQKEGYLTAQWKDSAEGLPPRKYYELTNEGLDYVAAREGAWQDLKAAISDLKGE